MRKSVLILGVNGRFGRHAAEAFWNAGWGLRTFDRSQDNLEQACRDVDVVIAAWNPPYPEWERTVLPMHRSILDAARTSGATAILPGNVYVFGEQTPAPWGPETPHAATNPLGKVRIALERMYRESGVQTIVLRAGDFMDPERSGNWLDKVILKPLSKGRIDYPGRLDAPHAWAYLPDLAIAAELLANRRDSLEQFEDISFPGYTLTGHELARAVGHATGKSIAARKMPWWPIKLSKAVWPMGASLLEMRYLWDTPHSLSGERFRKLCPDFPETHPDEAWEKVLGGLQEENHQSLKNGRAARHQLKLT